MKTVLIIEDVELNVELMSQLLEDDYKLLFARDGEEGVAQACEGRPDLILMDISLPILDGYEAARRIRATLESTPIIGLSAYAMEADRQKALEAGCVDYLTKPVDEKLLFAMLKKYLG